MKTEKQLLLITSVTQLKNSKTLIALTTKKTVFVAVFLYPYSLYIICVTYYHLSPVLIVNQQLIAVYDNRQIMSMILF